ncbi:hypothetical protein [Methanosarcina sp.]|nr:hypothetical protein [Methanosarcina sp.]MDY9924728.1 hypothetical protein [Methanosarcina sp.]
MPFFKAIITRNFLCELESTGFGKKTAARAIKIKSRGRLEQSVSSED